MFGAKGITIVTSFWWRYIYIYIYTCLCLSSVFLGVPFPAPLLYPEVMSIIDDYWRQQKDRFCSLMQSVSSCLFIGDLRSELLVLEIWLSG